MSLSYFFERFQSNKDKDAIIHNKKVYSYGDLLSKIDKSHYLIGSKNIKPGSVVAIEGDFTPNSIALLLALINKSCIIVPLTVDSRKNENFFFDVSSVEFVFRVDESDSISFHRLANKNSNNYYEKIRNRNHQAWCFLHLGLPVSLRLQYMILWGY